MNPMSAKNTNSKRPLVRTPEEEKFDQQNKETASEIHVQKYIHKKSCIIQTTRLLKDIFI